MIWHNTFGKNLPVKLSVCVGHLFLFATMSMDGSKMFVNRRLALGVGWAQGGRDYMQDAFALSLSCRCREKELDFFGVFDGHGPNGENVSRYVARNLCDIVLEHYESCPDIVEFAQSIEVGCMLLDDEMRKEPDLASFDGMVLGGSTACAVWVFKGLGQIYSCNTGDSRFILSYNGRAVPVTVDHKPSNMQEKARICNAGGFVDNDRVNGILGVARAFGDYHFKSKPNMLPHQQPVTALPDVRTVEIDSSIDFLVIASDGIWDLMSNQEVVDFISQVVGLLGHFIHF